MPLDIQVKQTPYVGKFIVAYICGSCGKRIEVEDVFELQEMLVWENNCGYGSVFGDGANLRLILCQLCVRDLLDKYIETVED